MADLLVNTCHTLELNQLLLSILSFSSLGVACGSVSDPLSAPLCLSTGDIFFGVFDTQLLQWGG